MKTFTMTCLCMCIAGFISAQTVTDFEEFDLKKGEFLNNSAPATSFESGSLDLWNSYTSTPDFTFWSGWAISADTNITTPGFMNDLSVISGGGADTTDTYAVGFVGAGLIMNFTESAMGSVVEGLYVNNGTYGYLSMLEGDLFAKRFGGETGDDPDYFILTIQKYLNGELGSEKVEFYLADYRFEDNSQDYIVKDWTWLDLTSLGNADSLVFSVNSTDIGNYGMNTPAYVMIDQVVVRETSTSRPQALSPQIFSVYPNPVQDHLVVDWKENAEAKLELMNLNGQVLKNASVYRGSNRIDTQRLSPGVYVIRLESKQGVAVQKFVKR